MKLKLIAVLAIFPLLAACGKKDTTTVSTPNGDVTITKKGDQVTEVRTSNGTMTTTKDGEKTEITGKNDKGEEFKITANKAFPESELGVPSYPGATPKDDNSWAKIEVNDAVNYTAGYTTTDPTDKVVDFYKGHLKTVTLTQVANDNGTVMGNNNDGNQVIIGISKSENKTEITVNVVKKKK